MGSTKKIVIFKLPGRTTIDLSYRKPLYSLVCEQDFHYDDNLTITFNTGDEEVTITHVMLAKIENSLSGANLCLSNHPVHHQVKRGINSRLERCSKREFFIYNRKSKI